MLVGTIMGLVGLLLGATSEPDAAFGVTPVEVGVSSEISVTSPCGDDDVLLVVSTGSTVWDVARFASGGSPFAYDLASFPERGFADVRLAVSCEAAGGALSSSTCVAVIFGTGGSVAFVESVSCGEVVVAPPAPSVFDVTPVEAGVSSAVSVTSACGDAGVVLVVPSGTSTEVLDVVRFGPGESPGVYDLAAFWPQGFADVVVAASCEEVDGTLSSSTCFTAIFGPGGVVAFVESISCAGRQVAPPTPPPATTTTTTAPPDGPDAPPRLPETGTSTRRLATAGVLLIVAGGAALLLIGPEPRVAHREHA